MKRFFLCALVTLLTFMSIFVTGCSFGNENNKLSIKDSLDANYQNLTEKLSAAVNFEEVADYLSDWAQKNNIKIKTKNDKYIILSLPATEDGQDLESVTLQSSIALNNMDETLETVACMMSVMYSASTHGQLNAIFTSQVKGKPTGAREINKKYLDTDNFIRLYHSGKPALYDSIAGTSDIQAVHKLSEVEPAYTKAYKVTFDGPGYISPYQHRSYPNPIQAIGDLLASCQSSSILFELASFRGGSDSMLLPKSASVTVVLQENDVEGFTRRFEKSFESISEIYENSSETFSYKMEETKVPSRVISVKDTANIVSLMYTLTNGTYFKSDDGEIIAASNIGKISTDDHWFRLNLSAKSLDRGIMEEMTTEINTTCGLCDITYQEVFTEPIWMSSDKYSLVNTLSDNPEAKVSGTLEDIDASALIQIKKDLNLAIYGISLDNGPKQIEKILEIMNK